MKNKLLTLILSLLVAQFLKAQDEGKIAEALRTQNNDTAAYLKEQILEHKDDFYL